MNHKLPESAERSPEQIPQEQIDFCREILQLAKEHGCATFTLEFRAVMDAPNSYHHLIKASWSSGRHGEPSNVLIQSERWDYIKV